MTTLTTCSLCISTLTSILNHPLLSCRSIHHKIKLGIIKEMGNLQAFCALMIFRNRKLFSAKRSRFSLNQMSRVCAGTRNSASKQICTQAFESSLNYCRPRTTSVLKGPQILLAQSFGIAASEDLLPTTDLFANFVF